MLHPTGLYHGKFGDTTGASAVCADDEEAAERPSSGRLHGNVLVTAPSRFDPWGPNQEYHGPLD